jgi:hypothetical protein
LELAFLGDSTRLRLSTSRRLLLLLRALSTLHDA